MRQIRLSAKALEDLRNELGRQDITPTRIEITIAWFDDDKSKRMGAMDNVRL